MNISPKLITLILFLFLLPNCQKNSIIEEPDIIKEKGIKLGETKKDVISILGGSTGEINFRSKGYNVSILDYDSRQIDYQPGYEGDDTGILAPSYGFREFSRKDYRFVFINNRLYSIQDFIHSKYYISTTANLDEDMKNILRDVKEMKPR